MIKYVAIGTIIAILLTPTMHVFASVSRELTQEERKSGFYSEENGYPKQSDRPAINPDFDPDEDCNIAYELKCIPGSEQECPEGFHNGEDNVCSPIECQEGFHNEEDNETGLCYPNEEGCRSERLIMNREMDNCGDLERNCREDPDLERCTVTINLGTPTNEDSQNCEFSVPDHCIEPYVGIAYYPNGTQVYGTDLSCYDLKPPSDFRVTIEDQKGHQLDGDYNGIACENNDR